MAKKLYVVSMKDGSKTENWLKFLKNVDEDLKGKNPSFGPSTTRIVSHHMDANTVHLLCTSEMTNRSDVTVEEVTKETLKSVHVSFIELVENYYLPYDDYPEIK